MAWDENKLAGIIVGEVAAVSKRGGAALAMPAAVAPSDFCNIWPKAKPILELLAGIAIFIPGAGATAGAVLQGLIKIGDQLSTSLNCGS